VRIVIVLACAAGLALAVTPRFLGPDTVYDSGMPIDVGYYAAPVMYDWNGDGAKDLICGQFSAGYIRLYPNVGPDSAPEFAGFSYFQADGSQITLPSG